MDRGVSERGDMYVDLGGKRRVTVTTIKGVGYVDLRKFWGYEGDLKPGKKGIMLSQEQWETLKRHTNTIDSFIAAVDE
ncbi:ssDNA-binding transcriptional regulator [Lentinus brumalis]|uniref:SsDNA-binding transcriptional regulator n=1 Tax=Lentinus brumalis TaxID=2498619 RepID=A0A371DM17_9APHY|nr:ssDNA-binding transcriptional regulator [Polyporus brumalis]